MLSINVCGQPHNVDAEAFSKMFIDNMFNLFSTKKYDLNIRPW